MLVYNKTEIKEALTTENIFELLTNWGGNPMYTNFGIICSTICHNPPGEGSQKLYYYDNSGLFRCYTHCGTYFDIFELTMKVYLIQKNQELDLNDAVRLIAKYFGLSGEEKVEEDLQLIDWNILAGYSRIETIDLNQKEKIQLKEYDSNILNKFNYTLKIMPWLKEGISQEAIEQAKIGFYPGGDQITIPHFDKDGRFVGLRGRTLCKEEGELYGKYRPIKICKEIYSHPLGMNLYNLNFSKNNIEAFEKAIVYEGEKSTLHYKSFFGLENDISVACCGSALSNYQVSLLIECGAKEIIVAFDRQFQEIGDNEFNKLKTNLIKLHNKYKNIVNFSFIFDKHMITDYKDSPVDKGKDIFLQLFNERIIL